VNELRARRLRAPLLLTLAALLALEAVGGLVIFFARIAWGSTPGEALHVVGGIGLTIVYAVYQWQHWGRVAPIRARLDYALGLIAALAMVATNVIGLGLGWIWWETRLTRPGHAPYPSIMCAAHNITSMLVLTFVLAHLIAVLARERRVLSELRR
jgi:hypothetical protein